VVADLAEALVVKSIEEAAKLPAAKRSQRIHSLGEFVDERFSLAPNYLGMSFALKAAAAQ
jgi:hypothetical protein